MRQSLLFDDFVVGVRDFVYCYV